MRSASCLMIMELLYTILLVIFSIFLIFLKYRLQRTKEQGARRPPSPPAHPILGHLRYMKTAPHLALQKLAIKYGPLIFLRFGIRPALVVSSPALADECFTKSNDIVFANRPASLASKHFSYNSTTVTASPYGAHWRNLRRVMTIQVFSAASLNHNSTIWSEEIHFTLQKMFSANSDGKAWKTVNMTSLFREMVFNVIMKMVAGKQWPSDQPHNIFSPQLLHDLCDYLPFLRWIGYKGNEKTVISVQRKKDKFCQDLVDETRKKDSKSLADRRRTVIEGMLDLQGAEPESYTDEIIKGIIHVMFAAGTHTSARALEWAMYYLLHNPEVLQKARSEIEENVTQQGHLIEDSDLSKLPYLRCIINETLRIFPPVPTLVPHYSSEDCTVGSHKVPKGTTLLVNAWAIHRDPKVWEEPDKFIPERFEGIDEREGSKFLPFGKGRRACPGATMAMKVVGLTLGTLIQCFEWEREVPEMVNSEAQPSSTPGEASYKPRSSMINLLSQL